MGIRFSHIQGELEIYRPDGRKFLTSVELDQEAGQAQLAAIQQAQRADHQTQRAEQAQEQAQQAQEQAQQAQEQAQQAQEQARSMVVNLLRSGMSAEQIADIAGVSVDRVNEFC